MWAGRLTDSRAAVRRPHRRQIIDAGTTPPAAPAATAPSPRFEHVARQASIRFGGLAFDKLLGYLFALVVAKTYGSTEFGLYIFGVGLFEVAFALSQLGLDRAAVRQVADLHARGRDAEISGVVRASLWLTTPWALAVALAIWLAAPALAAALDQPALAPFLQWAAIAVPASTVADALLVPTEGLGIQRHAVLVRMVIEPAIKVVLAVALFVALGEQGEIRALGFAYAASIVASAALAVAVHRRVVRPIARGAAREPHAASLLRVGLPACALHLLSRLLAWYDVFLIFTFVSAEATTHYAVAVRTAMLTLMIASAFEAAFKPAVAGALALGRRDLVAAEYLAVSRSVLMLCLPACVMLVAVPERVMAVVGDQFAGTGPLVTLVAVGTLAAFLVGPAASALVMSGDARTPLVNGFAGGAAGVTAAVLLVPRLGPLGAAIGQLSSLALSSALNAAAARRALGVVGFGRGHLRLAAAAAAAAAAGLAADALAPGDKYLAFLAVGAAVTLAYVAALAATGIRPEDLRLVRGVLHLPSDRQASRARRE